ncbi:MAG: MBL fold metallo-hydrolase [Rhizobacter sp.]|nr:MBL fold metallo-hydrolase [Rhizobacter sp.]
MRFCSLGSGSTGNATLVEASSANGTSRVLVDCGFSMRELESRLARTGLHPTSLDAIFVTHEHGDHVGCAVRLARRHGIALWMSRGTWRAIGEPDLPDLIHFARDGRCIGIGNIELHPFTVPHDAQEPLQLRCSAGAKHLGILTDAGSITPHLLAHLQGCDALLLECNHDLAMLAASNYPASLKARVGGRHGHLSNDTAAQILQACMHTGLRHLVAAHLSQQNNRPALARQALLGPLQGQFDEIVIADPLRGFDWLTMA